MGQLYQRQPGDFEIRILPDGRVVFMGPDEGLMKVAQRLEQPEAEETVKEKQPDE